MGKFEGMNICGKSIDNIEISSTCSVAITYDCNGGEGSTISNTFNGEDNFKLSKSGCYKITPGASGMVQYVKGWSTDSNASDPLYEAEASITNFDSTNGTITLYAVYDNLFNITGNYEVIYEKIDGNTSTYKNWKVRILGADGETSGNAAITFNDSINIDTFLVGGGAGGGSGSQSSGGGGGYTLTKKGLLASAQTYNITVGNGGEVGKSGETTTILNLTSPDLTVAGGSPGKAGVAVAGGDGGSGGGGAWHSTDGGMWGGSGGSYGANGKGGYGSYCDGYGCPGGSGGVGQKKTTCEFEQSTSGVVTDLTGCAQGVTAYSGGGSAASPQGVSGTSFGVNGINAGNASNFGGGGRGGGSAGGSGIVIIRNAR